MATGTEKVVSAVQTDKKLLLYSRNGFVQYHGLYACVEQIDEDKVVFSVRDTPNGYCRKIYVSPDGRELWISGRYFTTKNLIAFIVNDKIVVQKIK